MASTVSLLDHRVARFVIVGGGAAGMFFALSYLFVKAGMTPFLGSATAYVVAFICAYLAQRGWTFGGTHAHGDAFPRYLAAQFGCALLAGGVAHLAVFHLAAPPSVMSALSTAIASIMSYMLSSRWVFAKTMER